MDDREVCKESLRVIMDLHDRKVKGSHFDILIYAAYVVANEHEFEYILKTMPKEAKKVGELAIDYLISNISKPKSEH